jgi:hypothetical protein
MVNHIASPQSFWLLGIGTQIVAIAALLLFFKARRWF